MPRKFWKNPKRRFILVWSYAGTPCGSFDQPEGNNEMKKCTWAASILAAAALTCSLQAQNSPTNDSVPTGKGIGTRLYRPPSSGIPGPPAVPDASSNGIVYHGGPVMVGQTNLYYILYGTWKPQQIALLELWGKSIGGSPYYNIETTYYNGAGTHVSNSVVLAKVTTDNYSQGKNLSDAQVEAVVANAINTGKLPIDGHGLYYVLTSADVNETSGFCTIYCGWHTYGTINGAVLKYSFIGNAARCISACAAQSTSPNGIPGVDAMISVMAHELDEAVSDPRLNAWYFPSGNENADQCAWTFGTTQTASNGSLYNMVLGGREYLIQQNWKNADGGACVLSYP